MAIGSATSWRPGGNSRRGWRIGTSAVQVRSGKWTIFDRYVRDDTHFVMVMRYIEDNPVGAGLVATAEAWRWSSAWRRREA